MKSNHLDELAGILLNIKNRAEMLDFLKGILTPKEIEEITTRLSIVKMLKKGVPQHQIAKKLGVGVATVTRGSKEIKNNHFAHLSWWTRSRW